MAKVSSQKWLSGNIWLLLDADDLSFSERLIFLLVDYELRPPWVLSTQLSKPVHVPVTE